MLGGTAQSKRSAAHLMQVSKSTQGPGIHGLWSLMPDQLQKRLLHSLQLQALHRQTGPRISTCCASYELDTAADGTLHEVSRPADGLGNT